MNKPITLFLFYLLTTSAYADYETGLTAFDAGNYEEAYQDFLPYAQSGNAFAQTNLGLMYLKGLGLTQDYTEALKWFHKAATQGLALAQYNLGFMYQEGKGVKVDFVQAYAWFGIAAANGYADAIQQRESLETQLLLNGLEEARQLAREYWEKYENKDPDTTSRYIAISDNETSTVLVNNYTDFSRLYFEGLETFDRDQILDSLLWDFDFLLASHPSAPLQDYLKIIKEKVTVGYQHSGFPEVKVSPRLDKEFGRIIVAIDEGQRYISGGIDILGVKTIDSDLFTRRLTNTYLSPEEITTIFPFLQDISKAESDELSEGMDLDFEAYIKPTEKPSDLTSIKRLDSTGKEIWTGEPIWKKGEPAPFAKASIINLTDSIRAVFSEFGYFFPNISVNVVPEDERMAKLQIKILDEGPKAVINDIDISGNNKNTDEEILRYLELTTGMEYNRKLLTSTERLLWDSARFLEHKVSINRDKKDKSKIKLKIELNEYAKAPSLSTEFSKEQKALLNFRNWLSKVFERNEDIHFSVSTSMQRFNYFEVVLSNQGALILVKDSESAEDSSIQYAVIISLNGLTLFSYPQQRKITLPIPNFQIATSVMISTKINLESSNKNQGIINNLSMGVALLNRKPEENPIKTSIIITPVFSVITANDEKLIASINKDVLTITGPNNNQIKTNATSGELIELVMESREEDGSDISVFDLTIEKGTLDKIVKETNENTPTIHKKSVSMYPINSFVGFLMEELILNPDLTTSIFNDSSLDNRLRATLAIRKIFDKNILKPIDKLYANAFSDRGEFYIPQDQAETVEDATNQVVKFLAAGIFKYIGDFFPSESWLWTAARESVFVIGGKGLYTQSVLEQLHKSEDIGPIGYLIIAKFLSDFRFPPNTVKTFAYKGLEHLSPKDIEKDISLFLIGDTALVQTIKHSVKAIQELEEDDIEAITSILRPDIGDLIGNIIHVFREQKDQTLIETLSPVLNKYWNESLRKQVDAKLTALGLGI